MIQKINISIDENIILQTGLIISVMFFTNEFSYYITGKDNSNNTIFKKILGIDLENKKILDEDNTVISYKNADMTKTDAMNYAMEEIDKLSNKAAMTVIVVDTLE